MLIISNIYYRIDDPLSFSPKGERIKHWTPSPVGEGWEGGHSNMNL
jgi:hypothetical protein